MPFFRCAWSDPLPATGWSDPTAPCDGVPGSIVKMLFASIMLVDLAGREQARAVCQGLDRRVHEDGGQQADSSLSRVQERLSMCRTERFKARLYTAATTLVPPDHDIDQRCQELTLINRSLFHLAAHLSAAVNYPDMSYSKIASAPPEMAQRFECVLLPFAKARCVRELAASQARAYYHGGKGPLCYQGPALAKPAGASPVQHFAPATHGTTSGFTCQDVLDNYIMMG